MDDDDFTMSLKNKSEIFLNHLAGLIWPRFCASCEIRVATGRLICEGCESRIIMVKAGCGICGVPYKSPLAGRHPCSQCLTLKPAYACHRSLAIYEEPVRHLLHRYKFKSETGLATLFAGWILKLPEEDLSTLACDYIVPVPLHYSRLRIRLFNQSLTWARAVGKILGGKVLPQALRKIRETTSQTTLGQAGRANNLKEAFIWKGPSLTGKKILLVDDVVTTGSTLRACAQTIGLNRPAGIAAVTIAYNPKKS